MACWASSETAPVSSLVMSAETVAAGAPSTRVTVPWTSTWSTSATWSSGRRDADRAADRHLAKPFQAVDVGVIDAEDGLHDPPVLERV